MINELLELCKLKDYGTDKHSWHQPGHSYVEHVYDKHLSHRRGDVKNVLEIGVGFNVAGGSAPLWRDYFPKATVYCLDINRNDAINNQPRIVQIAPVDAYQDIAPNLFVDKMFDVMIDDGPHTLDSMRQFILKYSSKLKDDGVMFIEDIQDINWQSSLFEVLPPHMRPHASIVDLRWVTSRWDDIMLVVDMKEVRN